MSSTSSSDFPAPRVAPDLRHAFGGIWRLTLARSLAPTHWLTLAVLCGLLVLISLPFVPSPEKAKMDMMPWTLIYLTRIAPLMAFIAGGAAIRDEMKAGQVDYLFTRPVPRPAFLGFKFAAHLACLQFDFLLAFATVTGIALYRHFDAWWDAVPLLLTGQLLIVTAFSALGFLCGIVTTRFIIIGLVYGAIIEIGVGQIPTQINKLSMTHQIQAMLHQYLPPLHDIGPLLPAAVRVTPAGVGASIVALLGFTAIVLFVAGIVFSLLELSGPNES